MFFAYAVGELDVAVSGEVVAEGDGEDNNEGHDRRNEEQIHRRPLL